MMRTIRKEFYIADRKCWMWRKANYYCALLVTIRLVRWYILHRTDRDSVPYEVWHDWMVVGFCTAGVIVVLIWFLRDLELIKKVRHGQFEPQIQDRLRFQNFSIEEVKDAKKWIIYVRWLEWQGMFIVMATTLVHIRFWYHPNIGEDLVQFLKSIMAFLGFDVSYFPI